MKGVRDFIWEGQLKEVDFCYCILYGSYKADVFNLLAFGTSKQHIIHISQWLNASKKVASQIKTNSKPSIN